MESRRFVCANNIYKKDMVAVLEGLAESIGISTTYFSQTPVARDKRNKKAEEEECCG